MIYRDYSRKAGEWIPNVYGGRENLEALAFLRRVNEVVYARPARRGRRSRRSPPPGPRSRARRTSAASASASSGTWAGCTTSSTIMRHDPIHRKYHHNQLTFGMLYAWTENFVLPLSHDEVVHGKGSLARQDAGRRLAALREPAPALRVHVGVSRARSSSSWAASSASPREWSHDREPRLAPARARARTTAGVQRLVADLNRVYRARAARSTSVDSDSAGFRVDGLQRLRSRASWPSAASPATRSACVLCVANFTPVRAARATASACRGAGYYARGRQHRRVVLRRQRRRQRRRRGERADALARAAALGGCSRLPPLAARLADPAEPAP